MDLPVVPSFFRRIDVYQRLLNAENELLSKNIWDSEKIILMWAAGSDHKFVGSYITKDNVTDVLKREFEKRVKEGDVGAGTLIDYIVSFSKELMEALVMRGFAVEKLDEDSDKYKIRINPDGFLAGKILLETSSLESVWKYRLWVSLWWIVFILAFIVLLTQAFQGVETCYRLLVS